ncbi:cadherin-23 [Caerostris extrusa]|uniref:Cadherin-23 n=1 Tax=Caerostris extrusa TaxID=172846 RepID=A0AAV4Q468_CAEEX|nr:cadherin-23 [Caerostris extrusa]
MTVHAVDAGNPVQQTATATVFITVEDVNNKPPKFSEDSYVEYISESSTIGAEVLTVIATDPDEDAKIRYSIVEPIIARDKNWFSCNNAFRIDGTTGKIIVNKLLEYNSASVIILTVDAVDLNAVDITFDKQQKTSVEVTIYIRAHGEMNPVFSPPWTQAHPVIEITVPEETLIGSTLLALSAFDPLTHAIVTHFEKISGSDPDNYVSVSPVSDSQEGFGTIKYSISGDGSDVFDIDETSGTITIRENATLDREASCI